MSKKRLNGMQSGFSLMEMMIVLLIVAIVAAATAPMVNKKLVRSASSKSPLVWVGMNGGTAYNLDGSDVTMSIGATAPPNGNPRLYVKSDDNNPNILLGNSNNDYHVGLFARGGSIEILGGAAPENSAQKIIIGNGASAAKNGAIAIGTNASATNNNNGGDIAIGDHAATQGWRSVSIGSYANNNFNASGISTGNGQSGERSVAVGSHARAFGKQSVALGDWAFANHKFSVAIGTGACTSQDNEIAIGHPVQTSEHATKQVTMMGVPFTMLDNGTLQIGDASHPVSIPNLQFQNLHIPGNLTVDGITNLKKLKTTDNTWFTGQVLFSNLLDARSTVRLGEASYPAYIPAFIYQVSVRSGDTNDVTNLTRLWESDAFTNSFESNSDRRLKNVGEEYKAGLEEIKKLDLYHYTYKKDETKTPHVGVMAQDLQKIFPDAVTKGEDGYLRIRMEDMFYAVINAIKELDTKITAIIEKVSTHDKAIEELATENQVLSEQNKALAEQNKALTDKLDAIEKKIAKLEKKAEKVEKAPKAEKVEKEIKQEVVEE